MSTLFVALCNMIDTFNKGIAIPKNENVAYVLFLFKTWKYNDGTDIETWHITARVNGEYQFKEPFEITYHCEGKWWNNFKVNKREKLENLMDIHHKMY